MRHDPIFTSWFVHCSSPEEAQRLRDFLSDRITQDTTIENTVRACPDGVETQRIEQHRLGDYFADIRLLPGPADATTIFRILFERRPEAGRFWKDLIVRILRSLHQVSTEVTTTLDYRGDEDLVGANR
jgi:hypothetical protein